MSFNVSFIIKAVDSFSAPMQAVKNSLASVKAKVDQVGQSLDKAGRKMRNFGGGMTVGVTAPIIAAGVMAIKTAGDIESMGIAFETMLGSQEKANKLMKDLIDYAAKTPFEMPEIGQAARTLLAFNVSAENILPTLSRLGDIAAGANIPMNDLALIFGKVLSKGKLQAEELNQMSERGIPIMSFLEKQLGKSKAEIYKMGEQGKISAKFVVDAFAAMTSEGGLFFKMT
jgi:tape measure domain-containing protein